MLRRIAKVLEASGVQRGIQLVRSVEAAVARFVEPRVDLAKMEARMAELRRMLELVGVPLRPGHRSAPVAPRPVAPAPPRATSPSEAQVDAAVEHPRAAAAPASEEVPASAQTVLGSATTLESEESASAPAVPSPAEAEATRVDAAAPSGEVDAVFEAVPTPAARPVKRPPAKPARAPAAAKRKPQRPADAVSQLQESLDAHPMKAQLLAAGRTKDQLLRSLIPLYLAKSLSVTVSSGTTSKFWAKQGVKYAAPNVAKALREHDGYTRRTAHGPRITPSGIKYVEVALAARDASAAD